MDHFAGLDVSVKETSICIVDDTGRIVREVKVASEHTARIVAIGLVDLRLQYRPHVPHHSSQGERLRQVALAAR